MKKEERASSSDKASVPQLMIAGWICFVVGLGLIFLNPSLFWIAGPILFLPLTMSIVLLFKKRILAGTFLFLACLIVPLPVALPLSAMIHDADMIEEEQPSESI